MKKFLISAVITATASAWACGPFFQPSYIVDKNPYTISLNHNMAMVRLANSLSNLLKEKDIFPEGTSTKKAVIADFNAALEKYMPRLNIAKRQDLLAEYLLWDGNTSSDLPEEMQEFVLYRNGVYEMTENGEVVPPSWQKLLALPPEKRHFRTVWVHYMLGNMFKSECHKHYRNCRDAVRAGFADTPGLAKASLANEYYYGTDPVLKIHAAIASQRHNPAEAFIDKRSQSLFWQQFAPPPAILKDELCRELLAALNNQTPEFLNEMKKYKFINTDIMAYHAWKKGNWLAAQEYIDLMKKPTLLSTYIEFQLARMAGKDALALEKLKSWVQMAKNIEPYDSKNLTFRKDYIFGDAPMEFDIYGLLGNAMVLRSDFVQAAEFFYKSGQLESDFAAVADAYMSLDELKKFADQRIKEFKQEKEQNNDKARLLQYVTHLLARRAFRENRMDIAQKYMPEAYKQLLSSYLNFIAQGENKNLSPDQRALALYNAFKIMRINGMELCGTETEPDNFRYEGQFGPGIGFMGCKKCSYKHKIGKWFLCKDHSSAENSVGYLGFDGCRKCSYELETGKWTLCVAHAKEVAKGVLPGLGSEIDWKKIPDYWRFHYRYRAAKIALKAGELAQDVQLKAMINYSAGYMLANRSPQEADVFYKRLVNHSKGTKLATIADKNRWFPKNEVLEREQKNISPCQSLEEVHQLMQKIFTEAVK